MRMAVCAVIQSFADRSRLMQHLAAEPQAYHEMLLLQGRNILLRHKQGKAVQEIFSKMPAIGTLRCRRVEVGGDRPRHRISGLAGAWSGSRQAWDRPPFRLQPARTSTASASVAKSFSSSSGFIS